MNGQGDEPVTKPVCAQFEVLLYEELALQPHPQGLLSQGDCDDGCDGDNDDEEGVGDNPSSPLDLSTSESSSSDSSDSSDSSLWAGAKKNLKAKKGKRHAKKKKGKKGKKAKKEKEKSKGIKRRKEENTCPYPQPLSPVSSMQALWTQPPRPGQWQHP